MKKFNEYLKIVESKSASDFNLKEGDKVFTILGPLAGKDKYYGIVQTPILYQYPGYVCSVTFYDKNTDKQVGRTDEYAIDYLHRLDGQKIYHSRLKQNESYNIMSLIIPKKSEWFKVNDIDNNEYFAFKFLGNVYAIQKDNLQFIINNIGKYIKFKTQQTLNKFKLIMSPELLNKLNEYYLNKNNEEIEKIENGFKVTNGKGLTGTVVSINGDQATVLVDYENGPVKPYTTSININELESINEIFGFSKKEKNLKQLQIDINNAKKEIDQTDISNFFKETSKNPTNEELIKLCNIILYNVKYKIPTFLKLFPDIETNLSKDKPNAVSCIYDYRGKDLYGITLSSLSTYLKDYYYDKIDDNCKERLKKHLDYLLK